jgi:hypothetical protein
MATKRTYVRDILLTFEHPPIPDRSFDWRAMHPGDEEEPWKHGWGYTALVALDDLARLDREFAESLETETQRLLEEYP